MSNKNRVKLKGKLRTYLRVFSYLGILLFLRVEFYSNLIGGTNSVKDLVPTSDAKEFKLGSTTLVKYTNDADSKPYYYDKANKKNNYCAFENFFDKDMNKTLREFKGAAGGDADSSAQPVISVFNWTKD